MEDTHANAIACASSGLRRAAIALGAEVIARLEATGSRVEVTWFWGRQGERFPELLSLHYGGLLPDALSGTTAVESSLSALFRNTISERSQSFLLFPWQNGQKTITGVIGFAEPDPPVSDVPEAIKENLNLLGWAAWSAKEIARLREELRTVNQRLAGRKLVERAKSTLQAQRSISEEQAYEYLRNLSRRRRITLAELSAEILGGRSVLPVANRESV
jgi:hypothetical protein